MDDQRDRAGPDADDGGEVNARRLLRGVLLSSLLIDVANVHSSARAEALSEAVPRDALAPILDIEKLPQATADGRTISRSPAHHLQNVLRKRIARGEIPAPENFSMDRLIRVVGTIAALNRNDLGSWAGLKRLSAETDTSPSQIRLICAYLERHGHALNLSRLSNDDRKIAKAKAPLTDTRTTVRLVFPLTCDQIETLSEEAVLDLIALGDQVPRVKHPEPCGAPAAPPCVEPPPRPPRIEPTVEPSTVHELAPELRCLVEPLAATFRITGYELPIVWIADEADRAGLEDLERAAEAVCELNAKILGERRGAAAMGERPPKIKGGAAGLRARIISFLEGRALRLSRGGVTFQMRDDAREREKQHATMLSSEQRERRGLDEAAEQNPRALPAPPRAVLKPPQLTDNDRGVLRVQNLVASRRALMAVELPGKRAELERELAELDRELGRLLIAGGKKPPD